MKRTKRWPLLLSSQSHTNFAPQVCDDNAIMWGKVQSINQVSNVITFKSLLYLNEHNFSLNRKSNRHFASRDRNVLFLQLKLSFIQLSREKQANEQKAIMNNKTAWRLSRQRNNIEWVSFRNPFMSEQSMTLRVCWNHSHGWREELYSIRWNISQFLCPNWHPLHTVTRVSEHNW